MRTAERRATHRRLTTNVMCNVMTHSRRVHVRVTVGCEANRRTTRLRRSRRRRGRRCSASAAPVAPASAAAELRGCRAAAAELLLLLPLLPLPLVSVLLSTITKSKVNQAIESIKVELAASPEHLAQRIKSVV